MVEPVRCSKCGELMRLVIEYNRTDPYVYWTRPNEWVCPNGCVENSIEYISGNSSDMYLDPTTTNYTSIQRYCSQKSCICENANDRGYCEFTACIYENALNRGKNRFYYK